MFNKFTFLLVLLFSHSSFSTEYKIKIAEENIIVKAIDKEEPIITEPIITEPVIEKVCPEFVYNTDSWEEQVTLDYNNRYYSITFNGSRVYGENRLNNSPFPIEFIVNGYLYERTTRFLYFSSEEYYSSLSYYGVCRTKL
jgi:hypothetical protein